MLQSAGCTGFFIYLGVPTIDDFLGGSKVIDIHNELINYSCEVDFFDPWANPEEVKKEFNLKLINNINQKYESIILAVAHKQFLELKLNDYLEKNGVIFDVKGVFKRDKVDGSL